MKRLQFSKDIEAPVEKVYETMLGLKNISTYEQWTAEFNPTSTYEGSWKEGSTIYFIGEDENGKRGGMISEIEENIPFRFVSIRFKGLLKDGKEILHGPDIENWKDGNENYLFSEHAGITTVIVEVDTAEGYVDYFNDTWPKALDKLKEIVENH